MNYVLTEQGRAAVEAYRRSPGYRPLPRRASAPVETVLLARYRAANRHVRTHAVRLLDGAVETFCGLVGEGGVRGDWSAPFLSDRQFARAEMDCQQCTKTLAWKAL